MLLPTLFLALYAIDGALAVTVYSQIPFGFMTTTASAGAPSQTVAAAYNDTILVPPAIPSPPPSMAFTLALATDSNAATSPLSIPQSGSFLGFSIEMSVVTQVSKCPLQSCYLIDLSTFSW